MKRYIAQPTAYIDQARSVAPQAVIFSIAVSAFLIYRIGLQDSATWKLLLAPAIVFLVALIGVTIVVYLKRQALASLAIEISADRIRRMRANSPVVEILKADIMDIRLTGRGDLRVHGRGLRDRIMIPVEMQDREDLLDQLSELASELPPRERSQLMFFRIILIPVIILAFFGIIEYSRDGTVNPFIETAVCGLLSLALLARVAIVWLNRQAGLSVKLMELLFLAPVYFLLQRIWQIWS
ncbi:MAG: hypothetical protein NXI24_24500 [bacterium]|nr:hypothetical protein [bacterium]